MGVACSRERKMSVAYRGSRPLTVATVRGMREDEGMLLRDPIRARVALAVALTLMLAVVLGAPAGAAASTGCEPSSEALVTKVNGGEWYRFGGFSGQERTYICAAAGGIAVEIGQPGNEMASSEGGLGPTVQHLVFAGLTAAVVYENETGSRGLDVVYLKSGQVHFHRGLGGEKVTVPGEYSSAGSHGVGAIVVNPKGSVAWTEQISGNRYRVLEHEVRTKVLDGSGQVRPSSLTLTGSKLAWRERNGEKRMARLH